MVDVNVTLKNELEDRPIVFIIINGDTFAVEEDVVNIKLKENVNLFSKVRIAIFCKKFVCEYKFDKIVIKDIKIKLWGHRDFPFVTLNSYDPVSSRSSPRECYCCVLI